MGPSSPPARVHGAKGLTQDEEHLHGDVADKGVSGRDGGVVITREADVVGKIGRASCRERVSVAV